MVEESSYANKTVEAGRRAAVMVSGMWSVRGAEIREPASWLLGVAAAVVSVAKVWNLHRIEVLAPILAAVLVGFVSHELAHRTVARRYGLYAEFIAYTPSLAITFLSGFIPGLVILAPGYVAVYTGYYSYHPRVRDAYARSVAAGPATNIAISLASLALLELARPGPRAAVYLAYMADINAWMALFNLLPVPPLDGSKIFRWNTMLWAIMMAASIALMVV